MPQSKTRSIQTRLRNLVAQLPQPPQLLFGKRGPSPVLPDNIVCFQRRTASELNRPRQGRALHHRFVLIVALEGAAEVCVDDQKFRLGPALGLLVFPFQFHHYIHPESDKIRWLFVTFELPDHEALAGQRSQPFEVTPTLEVLLGELLTAYREPKAGDLPALLLAVFFSRLRHQKTSPRAEQATPIENSLVMQVNRLAVRGSQRLSTKQIADSIGISKSHLRARFRASCGVSLGHHLRRVRLEKACGLLRLGRQRVSDIAELCGFSTIYSFSRAFKTAYGESPRAYRRGNPEAAKRLPV
jgi:AraC-like DNA-binding protein